VTKWHVNEGLVPLIAQEKTAHPGMVVGTIGDEAHQHEQSDHDPNAAGRVNAADFMIDAAFTDSDAFLMVPFLLDDKRTKYVIWRRRIWRSPRGHVSSQVGWHDYTGSDPHTGHVHLSVWDDAHTDTTPWILEDDMTPTELLNTDAVPNPYPSAKATNNPNITVGNALKGAASADAKADLILAKLNEIAALLSK
jgi:hypothetical protein